MFWYFLQFIIILVSLLFSWQHCLYHKIQTQHALCPSNQIFAVLICQSNFETLEGLP